MLCPAPCITPRTEGHNFETSRSAGNEGMAYKRYSPECLALDSGALNSANICSDLLPCAMRGRGFPRR